MTKVIKQTYIPKKDCHIQCVCLGEHYVQFLIFERTEFDNNDKEIDELYVTIGGSEMSFMKDRLKAAWRMIRYGEFENHGSIVSRKSVEKIRDYLNEVLKYWDENYEKQ